MNVTIMIDRGLCWLCRFRRLFQARFRTHNMKPLLRKWTGNREAAVLYNPNTGKLYATIWHDGYGKYDATLFVGPLVCFRYWRLGFFHGWFFSLRPFPRVGLFFHSLYGGMLKAMQVTEEVMFGSVFRPISCPELYQEESETNDD